MVSVSKSPADPGKRVAPISRCLSGLPRRQLVAAAAHPREAVSACQRSHGTGASNRQAALRNDLGHQSGPGRNRLANAPWRHAGPVRNNPALKGLNIPKTGQSTYNVGTLVTKSLVIAGDGQVTTTPQHPRGAMLRAYDKTDGKEVGAVWMPAPQSGSPMTYALDGKQYIVVAVSGGNYSGEYIAFSLPSTD